MYNNQQVRKIKWHINCLYIEKKSGRGRINLNDNKIKSDTDSELQSVCLLTRV